MPNNEFKVIVIGNSGVGKTSLMIKYKEGIVASVPEATLGVDVVLKKVNIDGENISVYIWDTAGQERFHSMGSAFYRNTDAIIVVYAVTSRKSFDSIKEWLNECTEHGVDSDVPKIIIGNKSDCQNKEVTSKEGQNLAKNLDMPYYETSQFESDIEEIFTTLLRKLCIKRSLLQVENREIIRVEEEEENKAPLRFNCCTGNTGNTINLSLFPSTKPSK